jgi:hypothetical protein
MGQGADAGERLRALALEMVAVVPVPSATQIVS